MNIGKTTDVIVIELVEEPRSLPLEEEQEDTAPVPLCNLIGAEAA